MNWSCIKQFYILRFDFHLVTFSTVKLKTYLNVLIRSISPLNGGKIKVVF